MTSRSRLASAVRTLCSAFARASVGRFGGIGAPTAAKRLRDARSACLSVGAYSKTGSVGCVPGLGSVARAARLLAVVALTLGAWLALASVPALAGETHVFSSSFGTQGSAANEVSSPQGVAVNEATGDVYVADTGNARVDEFDSSGTFIRAWGWGVADGTTAAFQTCTTTCHAGISGSGAGQFTTPTFIAVDNSGGASAGDVYVGDTGDDLVTKFDASGNLISSWGSSGQLNGSAATGGPFTAIAGITLDTSGDLFVYDPNSDNMFEFAQDGTADPTIFVTRGTDNVGIGVDTAGNFYKVVGSNNLEQYSSSGNDIGDVTDDQTGSQITGFAVDPSTSPNDIYADDGGSLIRHYTGASLSTCVTSSSCAAADTFGSGHLSGSAAGLAIDPATGTVYAADAGGNDIVVFTAVFTPDVVTGQATSVGTTSATLNGTVNPHSTTITDCHFDYVDNAGYNPSASNPYSAGQTAACSPTPSGSSPVAVSAAVSSLTPGTLYHFRLEATNSNATSFGSDQTFFTPAPPAINGESPTDVSASGATLSAFVNPDGADTTYHFEYGTADCSTSACTSVPVPDADIGSGTAAQGVSVAITGLTASTTYYYRLVAHNTYGTTPGLDQTFTTAAAATTSSCPNAAFRQGPSANLPDCRAYELVSPPFEEGAVPYLTGVSPDGSNAIFSSTADVGNVGNNQSTSDTYEATRTPSGWSSTNLDPPASQYPFDGFVDASADLSETLWLTRATSQSLDELDFTLRDSDGTLHDLGPVLPPSATTAPPGLGLPTGDLHYFDYYSDSGDSADLSHVLFSLTGNNGFWPGDNTDVPTQSASLYEYLAGHSGPPALVGVDNHGNQLSDCGVQPGADLTGGSARNAVSAAGSTVFITARGGYSSCSSSQPAVSQLYARIGNPGSAETTVNVAGQSGCATSASCDVTSPPIYQGAAADGSKVFFTTTQQLVAGTSTDLYECDLPGDSGSTPTPTGVVNPCPDLVAIPGSATQSVVAISQDGSHVYYTDTGVLTNAPNQYGAAASSGANNLYLYQRDAAFPSGQVTFIGSLSSSTPQAEATPDGRFLAFADSAQLTPDDTSSAQQVFRYDAQTGELVRVSIGQDGFNDNGNTNTFAANIAATPNTEVMQTPLTISDDGAYVVFQSADGLTPQALNGELTNTPGVFANNVYEYHDGEVQLISDGRDTNSDQGHSSVLAKGTTAAGTDVFFTTADQLVPQDTDTQVDIYDARIDGGFAPSAAPPSCSGAACQGAPSSAPALPVAGSVIFSGPGDSTPGASTPKVKITKKSVKGSKFILTIKVPASGRITVTGAGVKTVKKSVSKAGSYRLTVRLTANERSKLKRGKKLKLKLRVGYAPAAGRASTATVSITVKA